MFHKTHWNAIKHFFSLHKPNRILVQRIIKCTINSTIAIVLCLDQTTLKHLGDAPAMLPLLSVMVHPGRRLGSMIEAVLFCSSGLLFGNAYALLGRFAAKRVLGSEWNLPDAQQLELNYGNFRAALVVLAMFEIVMLFFHGWMRSITHKFFGIVFPLFLVVHFAFTDDIRVDPGTVARNYTVPFFLGIGLSLACNLLIFPEFGSSYLGRSMIETLNEFHNTLDVTCQFFISMTENRNSLPYTRGPLSLSQITKKKTTLRGKLNSTQVVLQECSYEISYSFLSPVGLKKIIEVLKQQFSYSSALINASQLQFSTLLDHRMSDEQSELLHQVLKRTMSPIFQLQTAISHCLYVSKIAISYSYDVNASMVSTSPNLATESVDVKSLNFDIEVDKMARAMSQFDITFREEMKNLSSEYANDFSPNNVMFLLSSFLMNLKESANCACNILKESKTLYEARTSRENKGFLGRRIWFSFLTSTDQLKGWFNANKNNLANSAETISLNTAANSKVFIEDAPKEIKQEESTTLDGKLQITQEYLSLDKIVLKLCDFYEKFEAHFRFGFQITVGLMLASFPMFLPESRRWYSEYRGSWISFVCILVLEPEVGSTFFVFFLRGVGVISGAAWGYLSYVAAINQTNPYLETVITVFGAVPGYYFFLGTPYVKAAIIGIISIYIVLLSSALPSTIGGSILVNFAKRCLAMFYGGIVALACQMLFFPIKARDELVKEVGFATGAISRLILLYASGLEGETLKLSLSQKRYDAFKELSSAVKSSLIRADTFRASSKKEPRLKGSYNDIERVFYEIIFILREILDRIENIVNLRRTYGSAIIEEFNDEVYQYRRQVSASMSNSLKSIQLALLTKAPLPQYLPSPKVSQQRLIEKVREVVTKKSHRRMMDSGESSSESDSESEIVVSFNRRRDNLIHRQQEKFLKTGLLSWNATTAATEEIIQYIEELLELGKVLVGVNEFKYGFLSRSLYSDYATKATRSYDRALEQTNNFPISIDDAIDEENSLDPRDSSNYNPVALTGQSPRASSDNALSNGFRKRVYSIGSWIHSDDITSTKSLGQVSDTDSNSLDEEMPLSLMKVVTRNVKENTD